MHKVIVKNGHRTWFFRDEIVEIIGQDKLDELEINEFKVIPQAYIRFWHKKMRTYRKALEESGYPLDQLDKSIGRIEYPPAMESHSS